MIGVSIQPTLAMHFCGKDLHAISLTQKQDLGCEHNQNQESQEQSFDSESCCHTENIQIKTDDYPSTSVQADLSLQHHFVMELLPIFIAQLHNFDFLSSNTEQIFNKYPPQGLGNEQYDLLNHICIYRL